MFLVFDGIDGSGKTTQLERLAARLRGSGREVVTLRDPGGTELGQTVRRLLLTPVEPGRPDIAARAEVLLLLAGRAQSVAELIRPALARGAVVLGDRFHSATFAYQGWGAGAGDPAGLVAMSRWAAGGLEPDLTLVFELDLPAARRRLAASGRPADRFEIRGAEYFARVAEGFRRWPDVDAGRCVRIDAAPDPDTVEARVWEAVGPLLTGGRG